MSKTPNLVDALKDYLNLPSFDLDLNDLSKIEDTDIKLLWFSDYYDGDINGMLLYQNRKYWYQIYTESEDPDYSDYYRRYIVIELTESQLAEEEYWHTLFQEKVGWPLPTQPKEM